MIKIKKSTLIILLILAVVCGGAGLLTLQMSGVLGQLGIASSHMLNEEQYQEYLVGELAKKIQLMFSDRALLKGFHKKSYILAEAYSIEDIEEMWIDFVNSFLQT